MSHLLARVCNEMVVCWSGWVFPILPQNMKNNLTIFVYAVDYR